MTPNPTHLNKLEGFMKVEQVDPNPTCLHVGQVFFIHDWLVHVASQVVKVKWGLG